MNGLQIKPNPGFIRSLQRAFWERFLAPLKETQEKIVSFFLCHYCTWMRDLEQWQPSSAHEDPFLRQACRTAGGRWERARMSDHRMSPQSHSAFVLPIVLMSFILSPFEVWFSDLWWQSFLHRSLQCPSHCFWHWACSDTKNKTAHNPCSLPAQLKTLRLMEWATFKAVLGNWSELHKSASIWPEIWAVIWTSSGQFIGDQHLQEKGRTFKKAKERWDSMRFEGDHTQFGMAGDRAEEGSSQEFSSWELGCALTTTSPAATSGVETTSTKELVLTTTGVMYWVHTRLSALNMFSHLVLTNVSSFTF